MRADSTFARSIRREIPAPRFYGRRNRVLNVDEISGAPSAARFAGKEAVSKAFGTGIGKAMGWRNIDIRKRKSGEPFWSFPARRKNWQRNAASRSALITLSHTEYHAMACVVLDGK